MKRPCILLAILLAAASSAAIVEHRWRANVTAPAAAQFPVGRGETVSFVCDLVDGRGAPLALQAGTLAAMYWQTNGMGDVWYSGPATVSNSTIRVTWLPEYDPGAPLVRLFLSAEAPDGAIAHRAFANLRFYETPGTDPDVVPVPERVIDLAPVAVITNSPWARAISDMAARSSAESATNAVSDAMTVAVAENPIESTLEVLRLAVSDLWEIHDKLAAVEAYDSIVDAIDSIVAGALTNYVTMARISGYVPISRKVNNKALSADVTLSASDVGAIPAAGYSAISPANLGSSPYVYVEFYGSTRALAYTGSGTLEIGGLYAPNGPPCHLVLVGFTSVSWPAGTAIDGSYDPAKSNYYEIGAVNGQSYVRRIFAR